MSALQKKLQGTKLLPPRPPVPNSKYTGKKRDFTAIPWTQYFDSEKYVNIVGSTDTFHYYQKGELLGPVVVLLHGGGFSGLSWSLFCKALTEKIECCCIAIDQRGHGLTRTSDELSLSADQLVDDVNKVLEAILKETPHASNPVILVGHSMGGAISVHAAAKQRISNMVALIVIDVVEGSALDSLHAMRGVLSNRPKIFDTVEKANEWCIKTGYVRNAESARVSMIGQLRQYDSIDDKNSVIEHGIDTVIEEEEDTDVVTTATSSAILQPQLNKRDHYVWRIDLTKTSQYWESWFKGMSSMFLSVDSPKLLLLAGVDRLDAQMTTAQMQGKFQMQIVARSGHAVHEDAPGKVAEAVAGFLVRHKIVNAVENFKRPMPTC